jgi:hypothetical protein
LELDGLSDRVLLGMKVELVHHGLDMKLQTSSRANTPHSSPEGGLGVSFVLIHKLTKGILIKAGKKSIGSITYRCGR